MQKVLALLLLALAVSGASAQDTYPSRPIRLVVPFAPGNAGDIIARVIAPAMGELLGQNMVIENRSGAGGVIASEVTKKAAADGYTLMLVTAGTHGINASLYAKLAYDPVKDFTAIGQCASSPNVLVVTPQLPVNSAQELIALAQAKPGELSYGSSGAGTTVHLSGELFNAMAGVKSVHVPYKGAGEALNDLIAGRLQFMFASLSSSVQMVKAGKLRALAVTGSQRHPALPELPVMADFLPGFEAVAWYGIVGPAGLPQAVVEKLNRALVDTLKLPEVRDRLVAVGVDPASSSAQAFDAYIREEVPKWARVVKASGARAD
jgi:tripartite-type tricarboxylate transporter receptor subunit TctC